MEPFNPSMSYLYPHQPCFPASYQPLFMQQQLAQFRYTNFSPTSVRTLSRPAYLHYPSLTGGSEHIKTISEYSSIGENTSSHSLDSSNSLDGSQNDDSILDDDQNDPTNSGKKKNQLICILSII